jgi:hypothetical protein
MVDELVVVVVGLAVMEQIRIPELICIPDIPKLV